MSPGGKIIWTYNSLIERLLSWVSVRILAAITMGGFSAKTSEIALPDALLGHFEKTNIKGAQLRQAFKLGLGTLSPIPIEEVIIFVREQSADRLSYVILRRDDSAIGSQFVEASGTIFETQKFKTWRTVLLACIGLVAALSIGAANYFAQKQKVELEAKIEASNRQSSILAQRIKSRQTVDGAELAKVDFIEQFGQVTLAASQLEVLDRIANITPDSAWWRSVRFNLGSGTVFDMRSGNASEAFRSMLEQSGDERIRSGGQITVERPGVETFEVTIPLEEEE